MQIQEAVTKLADADKAVRDAAMGVILHAKDGAVVHLVQALTAPGAPVAKIALLLAAMKARDGLPRFWELLDKGVLDVDTRAVVARALGELLDGRDAFDDAAKRSLLRLSKDQHTTTRQVSVKALAAVGDAECTERLREMSLADTDPATKAAARDAWHTLRAAHAAADPGSAHAEGGGLAVDLEALLAQTQAQQAHGGDDAPTGPLAALILRLRDPRWAIRNAAVEEAVHKGKEAVPALIQILEGRSVGAKIGAAQALARIAPAVGAPDAARPLLDVAVKAPTTDDEKQLRPIALKALACTLTGGEEGMAQPLLPLTRDADAFVRAGALLCLGRLADRVGARAATLALNDPHDHVKEAAAVALSEGVREEDTDLVLPLLAVLSGMPSPGIAAREAILLALARIPVDDQATLVRLRHRVRPSVLGVTASMRRTAVGLLERCYTQDDPPPTGIVDDVIGRLGDDHPEVRLLAASFLAMHLEPGITGAVERIEDALDRGDRAVSLLCLDALRRHDTGKARLALEAAAEDPDEAVAARAKELLDGFAPKTDEWVAAAPPPVVEEPAPQPAPAPAVEAVLEPAQPRDARPVASSPAPKPRRVKPAGTSSGDVVEAVTDRADRADPAEGAAGPEAQASLRDQLEALKAGGLSEEELKAKRAAILARFG